MLCDSNGISGQSINRRPSCFPIAVGLYVITMSVSFVPAGTDVAESSNISRFLPIISKLVAAGMFTAFICTVPNSDDLPTSPAAISNFEGVTVNEGSDATADFMSSALRGATITALADVDSPVICTVSVGIAFPIRVVPLNSLSLPSPVASVIVG